MTVKKRPSDLTSLERFNLYYREREEELTTAERFRRFVWNRKTREFCGRTGASWYKIALFYLTFYAALALLVAVCMWTFLQLLDGRAPRWQLEESVIGTNPGLGFRPAPPHEASSVIWYRGAEPATYRYWLRELDRFLLRYTTASVDNVHKCDFQLPPPAGKVCDVDVRSWAPCVSENQYAYDRSTPCIFLKLNKIFGWRPQYYASADSLPDEMPAELREHIRNATAHDADLLNMVWVSCEGENPVDKENLGPVQYLPTRGFPGYYFPYSNEDGYLSPLVAVHFQRPKTGILINVECRAWARNIRYDRHDGIGTVHLELMLE